MKSSRINLIRMINTATVYSNEVVRDINDAVERPVLNEEATYHIYYWDQPELKKCTNRQLEIIYKLLKKHTGPPPEPEPEQKIYLPDSGIII